MSLKNSSAAQGQREAIQKNPGWVTVLFFLGALSACVPLAVYAYLGTFSRYLADDYCASTYLYSSQNIVEATLRAYSLWGNSYSRLMFSQLIELGGVNGIRAMAGVELFLWALLLAWMFAEAAKLLHVRIGAFGYVWLACMTIALSLYQTSALYQILFWRTGLIPYSLPLLWFIGIGIFFLRYLQKPYAKPRAVRAGIIFVVLVFFAGGLSETTSGMLVGMMFVAVALAWWTKPLHQRRDALTLLTAGLITAIIAISITAASPGTSNRLDRIMRSSPIYNPIELAGDVMLYTSQFLFETIKSYPSLILVALAISFCVMFLTLSTRDQNGSHIPTSYLRWALLIVPVVVFIVIGFSYAPSAFVRTFPAARARYASHFILTLGLLIEGGVLGILAARMGVFAKQNWSRVAVALLLVGLIIHPLRSAPRVYLLHYEYEKFATQWDVRDAQIREAVANGETDLIVVQLDAPGGVGEYKNNPKDWINRCVARFYGLNSIVAP
ncbi:MAG: hypothetical protein MHPDNHAH_00451 [Anaerolineales bacterium]|nr:hypothetical protein [Anaerolineales bacterium]